MALSVGIFNEVKGGETRVAMTPDVVKRLLAKFSDIQILVEKGAGLGANFADETYKAAGAKIAAVKDVAASDVVLNVNPMTEKQLTGLKKGALALGFMNPAGNAKAFAAAAKAGVNVAAVEKIPRTSRAQSMDALSSQANIGGYRAVLEAAAHLNRFFPVMMTAAGSSKPAKVMILGVGVAGLQAIATAKRLGAAVEAFDIRPEVEEQILSLGAKPIKLDLGEEGAGEGGYAKELSAEAKAKQQKLLQEYLTKADVVITTAQIPGRPAPILLTEAAVKGMAAGSVIVDMAAGGFNAANGIAGGNCPLTEADKIVEKHGVKIIGYTNYAAMLGADSSNFYARNLMNYLQLVLVDEGGKTALKLDMEDDIIAGSLAVVNGEVK